MSDIVISNIRFPKEDWNILKVAAASHGISVNEYLKLIVRIQTAREVTGVKKKFPRKDPYKALDEFIEFARNHKEKGMGASEDDKIIYDIE